MLHHGRRNPTCGANSGYDGSGSRSILGDTEVKENGTEAGRARTSRAEEVCPRLPAGPLRPVQLRTPERAGPDAPEAREAVLPLRPRGEEIMEMADEELLLASRARARLEQALSAAQHTQGHLQVVGVGEWNPTRTNPSWDAEPRLSEENPE